MQVSTALFALLAAVACIDRVSAQLPKTKCQSDHDGKGPLRDEPFELKIKSTGKGYACRNDLIVGSNKLVYVKCTGKLDWGSSIGIYKRKYFSCTEEKQCGPCFETYITGNGILIFESSKFVDQKEEINCKISPVPDMKNPTDATESPPILKTNALKFREFIDPSYTPDYAPILDKVPELQHQITVGGVKKQVFFSDFSRPEGSVVEKYTKVQNPEVKTYKKSKKSLISMDFFGKLKFKTSFRAPGYIKGNVEYDISEKFQVRTFMRMLFDEGKIHHEFFKLEIFEKSSDYGVTAKVTCEANEGKTECEKVAAEIKKKPFFEILIRSVFEATRTRWMDKLNEHMKLAKSKKEGIDVPFEKYFVYLAKQWISINRGTTFNPFKQNWLKSTTYKDGLSGRNYRGFIEGLPSSATVEMMEPTVTGKDYKFQLKFKPLKLYTKDQGSSPAPEKLDREVVYEVTVTFDRYYQMNPDSSNLKWTLVEPASLKDFTDDKMTKCAKKDITGSQTGDDHCKLWKTVLVKKDDGLLESLPKNVRVNAKLFFDTVKDPLKEHFY